MTVKDSIAEMSGVPAQDIETSGVGNSLGTVKLYLGVDRSRTFCQLVAKRIQEVFYKNTRSLLIDFRYKGKSIYTCTRTYQDKIVEDSDIFHEEGK